MKPNHMYIMKHIKYIGVDTRSL